MVYVHQNRFLLKLSAVVVKTCVLVLCYTVVIFGIFSAQFNNETRILRTIGSIRLELCEIKLPNGQTDLKNSLSLGYKGLQLYFSQNAPALIIFDDGRSEALTLDSYIPITAASARFQFTQGVFLTVTYGNSGEGLQCSAALPPDAVAMTISYRTTNGYTVVDSTPDYTIIGINSERYLLNSPTDTSGILVIRAEAPYLTYRSVQPESTLSYSALVGLDLASESTFRSTENAMTNNLVAAFESYRLTPAEEPVLAYIAAMGERNQIAAALSRIPASFLASANRSPASAPYFDNLEQMNVLLEADSTSFVNSLREATAAANIAFFASPDFPESLLRCADRETVSAFLLLPATSADNFNPPVNVAAAIIQVYSILSESESPYAALLEPVIPKCLAKIPESGSLNGGRFYMGSGDEVLTETAAVRVGAALLSYASVKLNPLYTSAGRLIINSVCFGNEDSFSLDTLAAIYRALNSRTVFTPRTLILAETSAGPVWALTAGDTVTYSTDALRRISLGISYPPDNIHHLIIRGINPFSLIEINDTTYRTDPRFETYNSSGFVYEENSRTLLLRLRQRVPTETVRLTY